MPTFRDHGFVLKTRIHRDADRRVTIFTRDHGKLEVLAKGSRKEKSKMAGALTVPGELDVLVATGRLTDHLAGVAVAEGAHHLMESLVKTAILQACFHTAEAFTRREQADPRLYDFLKEFLFTLDALPEPSAADRVMLLGAFVMRLTDLLGFGLELGRCVKCRRPLEPEGNALNVIRGGVECRQCRDGLAPAVTAEGIKALRYLRDATLVESVRLAAPGPVLREISFLTELQLAAHLEGRLPALRYLQALT
jgi:DNA repair protein RecO (recombination protein O)